MFIDWDELKPRMLGQWVGFLTATGFDGKIFNGKHQACPVCGGKDRFRFDNEMQQLGDGGYICNQCGSGDGASLYLKGTGCDFKEMVSKCANYLNFVPIERQRLNLKQIKAKMPLKQERHDIKEVLNNCEKVSINDEIVYKHKNGNQVVILTDLAFEPVSLIMLRKGTISYLNKEFIYSSCVVLGEIKNNVVLTSCWFQAYALHYMDDLNVICIFEPLNIHYITKQLKSMDVSFKLICHDEEALIQADKHNITENVFYKGLQTPVDVSDYEKVLKEY